MALLGANGARGYNAGMGKRAILAAIGLLMVAGYVAAWWLGIKLLVEAPYVAILVVVAAFAYCAGLSARKASSSEDQKD